MYPLTLSRFTLTTCLGVGLEPNRQAIVAGRSGLTRLRIDDADFETHIGEVSSLLEVRIPPSFSGWDCRNNRLAYTALQQDAFLDSVFQAAALYGRGRIGVFIGTSTSGIRETEEAFAHLDASGSLPPSFDYRKTHACFSVADFVRRLLKLEGPAFTVSTACSSSAKVFPAAARMISSGLIDAAVVGGVDTLCRTTLFGFRSLELTALSACKPFDVARSGISFGEAGAFVLLERPDRSHTGSDLALFGAGESSDAYHMSSPHPEGLGARIAIAAALESARLSPEDIDYVNLHGTGTRTNDSAEDIAVVKTIGGKTPCSSTKGSTGHTLGAAGAVEIILSALAIQEQIIPGGVTTEVTDPGLHCNFVRTPRPAGIRRVLSNSFGFGGSNCALIIGTATN